MGFGDFVKNVGLGGLAGLPLGPMGASFGMLGGGAASAAGIDLGKRGDYYNPNKANFGVPGYSRQYDNYGQQAVKASHRNAPQMVGANMGPQSQFRGNQSRMIRDLEADAAGNGPAQQLVRMQAQGAADRALAQAQGSAAGAAPGSGAAAARTAALAGGAAQSQVGQQAAEAGMQARQGAMGQLGLSLYGARGQDDARSQANMNADLATQQANMGAQLQQTGMNDQTMAEMLRQRLAAAGMQQQGGISYEQLKAGGANMAAQQPALWEKLLGATSGAAKMGMMAFGGPAGMAAGGAMPQPGGMGGNGSAFTPWGSPR